VVLDEFVEVQYSPNTYKHFEALGYVVPRKRGGVTFKVRTEHLPEKSRSLVRVRCDKCKAESVKSYDRRDSCLVCRGRTPSQKVRKIVEASGFSWLGGEYRNNRSLLDLKCLKCSTEFAQCLHEIEKMVYVCPTCYLESLRERVKGENNPMHGKSGILNPAWDDSLTDADRALRITRRQCKKYQRWSYLIKEAAGFICDCCRENRKLNSHHLKNWKDHPKARYDVTNGVCLCEECHKAFHAENGKSCNTAAQYYQFKENSQCQHIAA